MSDTPIVYNQLEIKDFKLMIDRIPNTIYHCTSAPLPGISSNPARIPTPFTEYVTTSSQITFQPLIVNFIVDEKLRNHAEIFDWIVSYAAPSTFDEYANPAITAADLNRSKKSDGTLIFSNNKYNDFAEYQFEGLFPIDVSEVMADVQIDDVLVSTCTVTFEFTRYYRVR